MKRGRAAKARRGLGVALALGFCAFAVAPTPAQAQGTSAGNFGGLQFNLSEQPGQTTSTVTFTGATGGEPGTVTVSGGNYNYNVTQTTIGSGGTANAIKITGGYSGTITLDHVTLDASSSTENGSVITFGGTGATVVVGNGTTLTGSSSSGTVAMGSSSPEEGAKGDTLVVESGGSVVGEGGQAVCVQGQGGGTGPVNTVELAGGALSGGKSTANGPSSGDGVIDVVTANLAIEVSADSVVTGTPAAGGKNGTPGATALSSSGAITIYVPEGTEGTPTLTLQGGDSTKSGTGSGDSAGTAYPGAPGITLIQGTLQLGTEDAQGCNLQVVGGEGSSAGASATEVTNAAQGNYGGAGILVFGKSGTVGFTVNSGALTATGGVGGSLATNAEGKSAGNGGYGVYLCGTPTSPAASPGGQEEPSSLLGDAVAAVAEAPFNATLTINGGTVNIAGGMAGEQPPATENESLLATATPPTGGIGIGGWGGAVQQQFLNVSYNDEVATEPPVVTVQAGTDAEGQPSDVRAITNVGGKNGSSEMGQAQAVPMADTLTPGSEVTGESSTGANITINGGSTKSGLYQWVAYTTTTGTAPTAQAQGTLQGFAGMNGASNTNQETNPDQYDKMQQQLVSYIGSDGTITNPNSWVRIEQAPIESLQAGVVRMLPANGMEAASYVVAQTPSTMSGVAPSSERLYKVSVVATFEGVENVDTSSFSTLAGSNATIGTNPSAGAAGMTSTSGVPSAGEFYVVPSATGNELALTPGSKAGLKGALAKMYPNLTVGPGSVPVVYTVAVSEGPSPVGNIIAGTPGATPTGQEAFDVYTAPDGSGNLVALNTSGEDTATSATATPTVFTMTAEDATTPLQTIVVAASPASNSAASPWFMGLFDQSGTEPALMPNNQVSGWSSNAQLSAEWGSFELQSVEPSPTTLTQGTTTNLTATYAMTPNNSAITAYNMHTAAAGQPAWDAVYVGQQVGSAQASGVTVEGTSANDATPNEEGVFTVTATATVSASASADVGRYRVWPVLANTAPYSTGQNPQQVPTGAIYAEVEVVASAPAPQDNVTVVRMYNPFSLEHLYTVDANEVSALEDAGWDNEGEAWVAPPTSSLPIYRLYNRYNGDHLYTISQDEYSALQTAGWKGEGVKLYSAPNSGSASIYRLYNPYMTENGGAYSHLWTADFNEYQELGKLGWKQESVAFWALQVDLPTS